MKTLVGITVLMLAFVPLPSLAAGCPGCGKDIYPDEEFCGFCGLQLSQAVRLEAKRAGTSAAKRMAVGSSLPTDRDFTLPIPLGVGRGLCEIAGAPFEPLRMASVGFLDMTASPDAGQAVFGSVCVGMFMACVPGPIYACADICVGAADVLTLGTAGNVFWTGKNERRDSDNIHTPYPWQRSWKSHAGQRYSGIFQ